MSGLLQVTMKFLLTPLREGRHKRLVQAYAVEQISTHAPAGGATCRNRSHHYIHSQISTHAPAGGATKADFIAHTDLLISTHAPAGGATLAARRLLPTSPHFYSRPCGRGDFGRRARHTVHSRHFYSRPCGRGDPIWRRGRSRQICHFYSRPCGRGDRPLGPVHRRRLISTHAPAGGATWGLIRIPSTRSLFLLTPLREGRQQFSTSPS